MAFSKKVIANKVKQKVKSALVILGIVEEAIEQFFSAENLSAQRRICTTLLDDVEHVLPNQIQKAVIHNTINNHVDKYLKHEKFPKAFGMSIFHRDDFPKPMALYVRAEVLDSTADQGKVRILRTIFMRNRASRFATTAAEASFVQEAQARTISGSSIEESSHRGTSHRDSNCTCSRYFRNRRDKSSESDSAVSFSATES